MQFCRNLKCRLGALGLALTLLVSCVVIMPQSAWAACPDEPTYTWADPMFVQKDRRRPQVIPVVRAARARGALITETDTGVFWLEVDKPRSDDKGAAGRKK